MNPTNLFKYLEKEKGIPIPLRLKFIFGLPLTPDELNVRGDLSLYRTEITSLPQGLKVEGFLDLDNTEISFLPPGLKVGGSLYLDNTEISFLPPDLKIEENLYVISTPLAKKQTSEIRAMLKTGYIKGKIYRFYI